MQNHQGNLSADTTRETHIELGLVDVSHVDSVLKLPWKTQIK